MYNIVTACIHNPEHRSVIGEQTPSPAPIRTSGLLCRLVVDLHSELKSSITLARAWFWRIQIEAGILRFAVRGSDIF